MSTPRNDLEAAGHVLARSGREDLAPLVGEALAAARRAYAPYSRFWVGAVVVTGAGRHVSGCNVENVSYPIGTCAERNALAAYVLGREEADPVQTLTLVAVQESAEGPAPVPCSPCGACRQAILELAPGAEVHFLWGSPLTLITARAPELLPRAFHLDMALDAQPETAE